MHAMLSFRNHDAHQHAKYVKACRISYHAYVGGNSKVIFELCINKIVFSESVSQRWNWSWLTISSSDVRLERNASLRITSFCSHVKLSIDIFIISVRKIFAEFGCIFMKRSFKTETGEIANYLFSLFYKRTTLCWYCECTQIQIDPLQFQTMYYSSLYEQKLQRI